MTAHTYRFEIDGLDVDGVAWQTTGTTTCELHDAFDAAMKETFQWLTHGKASYGNPGAGCTGPYTIRRVLIERRDQ